jgi:hypothetical protein
MPMVSKVGSCGYASLYTSCPKTNAPN